MQSSLKLTNMKSTPAQQLHPPQPGDTNEEVAEFARSEGQQKAQKEKARAEKHADLIQAAEAEDQQKAAGSKDAAAEIRDIADEEEALERVAYLHREVERRLPSSFAWTTPCSTRVRDFTDDFFTKDGAALKMAQLPVGIMPTRYYRATPTVVECVAADDLRPNLYRTRDLGLTHYINVSFSVEIYLSDWASGVLYLITEPGGMQYTLDYLDEMTRDERLENQILECDISLELILAVLRHQPAHPESMLDAFKLVAGITSSITQVPMSMSEQLDPVIRNEILVALAFVHSTCRDAPSLIQQGRDAGPRGLFFPPPPGVYSIGAYVAPPAVLNPMDAAIHLTKAGQERLWTSVREFPAKSRQVIYNAMRNGRYLVLNLTDTAGAAFHPNWGDPRNILSAVNKRLNGPVNEAAPHRALLVGPGGTYDWIAERIVAAVEPEQLNEDELFLLFSRGYAVNQLQEIVGFWTQLMLLFNGTMRPEDLTQDQKMDHFSFKHFFKRESLAEYKPPRFIMSPTMTMRYVYWRVNRRFEAAVVRAFGSAMVKHLNRGELADRVKAKFNGGVPTLQADVSNMEKQMGGRMRDKECELLVRVSAQSCDHTLSAAAVPFWAWFYDTRNQRQHVCGHHFHLNLNPMRFSGEGQTSSGNATGNLAMQGAVRLRMYQIMGRAVSLDAVMQELLDSSLFEGDDSLMQAPQGLPADQVAAVYQQACQDVGVNATAVVEFDPLQTKFCKLRLTAGGTVSHDFWVWMRSMFSTSQRYMMDTNEHTPVLMRVRAICQLAEPAPRYIHDICRSIIDATEPWRMEMLRRINREAITGRYLILKEFVDRVARTEKSTLAHSMVLATASAETGFAVIKDDDIQAAGSAATLGPQADPELRSLSERVQQQCRTFFEKFKSDRDTLPLPLEGEVPGPQGPGDSVRWTYARRVKEAWWYRALVSVGRAVLDRANWARATLMGAVLGAIFFNPALLTLMFVGALGFCGFALLASIVIPLWRGKSPFHAFATFLFTLAGLVVSMALLLMPFKTGRALLRDIAMAVVGWATEGFTLFHYIKALYDVSYIDLQGALDLEDDLSLGAYVVRTRCPTFIVDWVQSPFYNKLLRLIVLIKMQKMRLGHAYEHVLAREPTLHEQMTGLPPGTVPPPVDLHNRTAPQNVTFANFASSRGDDFFRRHMMPQPAPPPPQQHHVNEGAATSAAASAPAPPASGPHAFNPEDYEDGSFD